MPSRRLLPFAAVAAVAAIHAAPAAASEGGAPAVPGLFLVPMEELDVPIVEGPRADGRLRVKLVLRAADAHAAARLQEMLPQLREASFIAAAEFARLYASPFAPVDAQRLARELTDALHARDPGIKSVLLVQVLATRS